MLYPYGIKKIGAPYYHFLKLEAKCPIGSKKEKRFLKVCLRFKFATHFSLYMLYFPKNAQSLHPAAHG
jgi:hypothetical protein